MAVRNKTASRADCSLQYADGHQLVDSVDKGKRTDCTVMHSENKGFLLNRFWPKEFLEYMLIYRLCPFE